MAHLTVTSIPDLEVFLDGAPLGRTPLRDHPVHGGHLAMRLRDGASGLERTLIVDAKAGDDVHRDLVLGRGQLVVNSHPWADVYLGGRKLGSTPLPPLTLYEGSYKLRLVRQGQGPDRTILVSVVAGQTTKINESLEP